MEKCKKYLEKRKALREKKKKKQRGLQTKQRYSVETRGEGESGRYTEDKKRYVHKSVKGTADETTPGGREEEVHRAHSDGGIDRVKNNLFNGRG